MLRVLIVDDSRAMREEFRAICKEFVPETKIEEASDAMEAMALLQKGGQGYDIIFTDINMPNITGLQLISHIRELPLYKSTPVIVISVLSERNDIEKAMQLGASGYLTRPLKKEDFEVIAVAFLRPLLEKRKAGKKEDPQDLTDSLRRMFKQF